MKNRIHILLLLFWLLIGSSLRFTHLAFLPPWTDECATIVFSLGNSFQTVPLNQVISSNILLEPLLWKSGAGISDVIQNLANESTHPPLYFILTHLWMQLFSNPGEMASIWAARALSAFFGVASIPAMFGFGYLAFRSKLVAQIAAAMMAVSPYNVFLAREARHYTLAILLVIVSLSCLVKAIEIIHQKQPLPLWMGFIWVTTNIVGVATHYFFALTLCAEGLVLIAYLYQNLRRYKQNRFVLQQRYLWRIWLVVIASVAGCLFWLPMVQSVYGSEPTNWVVNNNSFEDIIVFLAPIGRLLLWVTSLFSLLPSAVSILPIWVVVVFGIATLLFLLWAIPYFVYGLKGFSRSSSRLSSQIVIEYIFAAIAVFLFCTYILSMDLTLAPRFIFIFAPAVILLVSAALKVCWQRLNITAKNGKVAVIIIWLLGLIGGLTTVSNLGYLQHHRADLLASLIHKKSEVPVLIATTHKHHGQTGRIMGLAWELKHLYAADSEYDWQFFLADRNEKTKSYADNVEILQQSIGKITTPLDVWLVNFRAPVNLEAQQCFPDKKYRSRVGEYSYKLYHCQAKSANADSESI